MTAIGEGRGSARRGLVVDVETRIDRAALGVSGRIGAPRGMPPGLQTIVAAAVLSFEIEGEVTSSFALNSASCAEGGEATLVGLLDRELARLRNDRGVLITFNGLHDLGAIRLASLRHALFRHSGAASWMAGGSTEHVDVMRNLAGAADREHARLADLVAVLGISAPGGVAADRASVPRELAKCEADVVATMALYMHLLCEGVSSAEPLRQGIPALAKSIGARLDRSPHLSSFLDGRLFRRYLPR